MVAYLLIPTSPFLMQGLFRFVERLRHISPMITIIQ